VVALRGVAPDRRIALSSLTGTHPLGNI
jgi:hypothetical protein